MPSPTPAGCASASPNTPDGPDPSGGCFPGPASTGVPAGTQLTAYTGPCTVTVDNTAIDAKTINCGTLTIAAANVQITRSKVNGSVWIDSHPSPYSFTISDSEVAADSSAAGATNGATGIGKSNFTALRDNVHGGIRAIWCEYSCAVRDSYLHGQLTDQAGHAHESGTRIGDGSTLTHNSIVCDAPNVAPDAGCSADVTGYGDFATIQNDTLSNNLFMATTGGTCVYGGSTAGKPFPNANHIVFEANVFGFFTGDQGRPHCGYYFSSADFDTSAPGNAWTGNVRTDGASLSPNQ